MKFFGWLKQQWDSHGTKILGTAAAINAGMLTVDGLISAPHKKYYLALGVVLAALTVNRGFENSKP